MPRDAGLEALVRDDLPHTGFTEKAMFGGWAWLWRGNLMLGARVGHMLVRLGTGRDDWALALPDIRPMEMRGRVMPGWLWVGPAAYGDDALRRRLIEAAQDFVRTLPPK